jgi:aminoglycoside phosphotransferase (APT) family kinase protein
MKAMHADELHTDAALVRRLLAGQFPQWAELPIERVPSAGTSNALYRLGNDMVVRLPRIHWAARGEDQDFQWLPRLAPLLPVAIPVPLAKGIPAEGYPWEWGIYTWLEGENPVVGIVADPSAIRRDAVQFVDALHRVDLADGPPTHRGASLEGQDESARAALVALEGMIDTDAASAAWDEALGTPGWSGPPVWIHGDLLPGNLLVEGGRLTGVIDWGLLGIGDPACDMIIAWSLLPAEARKVFRAELDIDDATWTRGRGWALSIALIALPYYKDTNPVFADVARHLIREVLADNPGNLKS